MNAKSDAKAIEENYKIPSYLPRTSSKSCCHPYSINNAQSDASIAPRQSPNRQIRLSGKIIHHAKSKNRISLDESDHKITANASLEVLLPQSRYVTIKLVKGVNVELGDISNTPNVKAKPLKMESAVLVRIL